MLGLGRNWRTFARTLAKQAASESGRGWQIALVDLRNHGRSTQLPGFEPPHTLTTAAQDLTQLIQDKFGGQDVAAIVGHSLGGKITLEYLRQTAANGSQVPQQAWILDVSIGKSDKHAPTDVDNIVTEIRKLQAPITSREWLYDYMEQRGYSLGFRMWMGSNLVPDGQGKLKWGFNVEGANDMGESYKQSSFWGLVDKPPKGTILNIARAANSDRWTPETVQRLQQAQDNAVANAKAGQSGQTRLHVLPNAGHWLHVDNLQGLMKMMLPSFVDHFVEA